MGEFIVKLERNIKDVDTLNYFNMGEFIVKLELWEIKIFSIFQF